MRLSEALPTLHPAFSAKISELRKHDDPVSVQTAALFLGVGERMIRFLCERGDLEFIAEPYRKIFQGSLIRYFLRRHKLDYIEID